jgi:anhydro-N-acetylmuramic acid kinase
MTTTAIGIMSGTSLDGLDIAFCDFSEREGGWDHGIRAARCVTYSDEWRERLATAHLLDGESLAALDADFGRFIAQQTLLFLKEEETGRPDLISSHGHTVFHAPSRGFTVQIGSGARIAADTGITTVCDFRSMDVALGGQGAPLVPVGDRLLFGAYAACLNLGGFSNISFEQEGRRTAFDICPVNILLNPVAGRLGHAFDRGGELAASGRVLPGLLGRLNALPCYHAPQRVSLSREWLEAEVLPLLPVDAAPTDLLRTLTEHAAMQVASVLNGLQGGEVLLTGGGAFNAFLVKRMGELCGRRLTVPDRTLVEFKEALVFALLGVLRLRGEVNVLRSVTGARTDSCSGAVYTPPASVP